MVLAASAITVSEKRESGLWNITRTGFCREMSGRLDHDGTDDNSLASQFLDIRVPLGKAGISGSHGLSGCYGTWFLNQKKTALTAVLRRFCKVGFFVGGMVH